MDGSKNQHQLCLVKYIVFLCHFSWSKVCLKNLVTLSLLGLVNGPSKTMGLPKIFVGFTNSLCRFLAVICVTSLEFFFFPQSCLTLSIFFLSVSKRRFVSDVWKSKNLNVSKLHLIDFEVSMSKCPGFAKKPFLPSRKATHLPFTTYYSPQLFQSVLILVINSILMIKKESWTIDLSHILVYW